MTEESYQQGRKFMQRVNHVRSMVTGAKGNVSKWTRIESAYRDQLQEGRANGANEMLKKAIIKLDEWQEKFKKMEFPASNIKFESQEVAQCEGCGMPINKGLIYCGECLWV